MRKYISNLLCLGLWLSLAMGVIEASGALSTKKNAPGAKPNFIVILTDDQGYADVGCYGAAGFQTPHLDRLAGEGMRFDRCFAVNSICTPSRATILTGRNSWQLKEAVSTLVGHF